MAGTVSMMVASSRSLFSVPRAVIACAALLCPLCMSGCGDEAAGAQDFSAEYDDEDDEPSRCEDTGWNPNAETGDHGTGDHGTGDHGTADDGTDDDSPPLHCGDGLLDPDELCDDGPVNGTPESMCLLTCEPNVCGDGILGSLEHCDDGNTAADDGCPPQCLWTI